jgi:ParB family transcriptional regulator, chromosome partitioning protein
LSYEITRGWFDEIRIGSIIEPELKVREYQGGLAGLVASILRQGLLEPILVRPKDGKFELVAGSRRLGACKLLGWRKIPCQVVQLDDKEALEVAISENVARKSLDALEEARAFEKYVKKFGWGSQVYLANKIGKSQTYVSRRLALLKLPEAALNEILLRRKNPSLAAELATLGDEELIKQLERLAVSPELSVRVARKLKHQSPSGPDWLPALNLSESEKRNRRVELAVARIVVALRLTLRRLDDVIENVGNEDWILREILLQTRQRVHSEIDLVGNLVKRIEKRPT